jgi:hypothetical protein
MYVCLYVCMYVPVCMYVCQLMYKLLMYVHGMYGLSYVSGVADSILNRHGGSPKIEQKKEPKGGLHNRPIAKLNFNLELFLHSRNKVRIRGVLLHIKLSFILKL